MSLAVCSPCARSTECNGDGLKAISVRFSMASSMLWQTGVFCFTSLILVASTTLADSRDACADKVGPALHIKHRCLRGRNSAPLVIVASEDVNYAD